jgi:hypothetical protein
MRKLLILAGLLPLPAIADGGAVLLHTTANGLIVTVFSTPSRPTAGPVDFSVLLQKGEDLDPVLDADVSLHLRASASGTEVRAHATRGHAQNKLLYAAPVTLLEAGKWQLTLTVLLSGVRSEIAGALDVAPTRAMVASYWGYIAFPPAMIVLFAIREWLLRRKRTSKGTLCVTISS